jgi:hypothetical protein
MVWRYDAVLEKTKQLFELSTQEIEIRTEAAKRIESQLADAVKRRDDAEANALLTKLHSANNAISDAASRRPWLDPIGTRDTPLALKMSNATANEEFKVVK